MASHSPQGEPLRIFLVAGEVSGDRLGASLMRALSERHTQPVQFSGVGGPRMTAAGLTSLFPIDDLAFVGFTALSRVWKYLRHIREAADAAIAARPDVLVVIDCPDFTLRVARRVRRAAPSIPIIDYVSPSVWAWRSGRARAMRSYVDHVLALLPFEPRVHATLGGPACTYVGHPMIEEVAQLRPSGDESRRRLTDPPVLLVLPGSRSGEIKRLLGVFGETVSLLRERYGALDVVMPTLPHLAERLRQATASWPAPPRIVVDPEQKQAAFRIARAALVKSGTGTLEVALAGVPMVTAYKVPLIEECVGRVLINVPSIILANLVLGENAIPEFLQRDCTADNLAKALLPLLRDSGERRHQIEAFARLDAIMEIGTAIPSQRAADIVLRLAAQAISGPRVNHMEIRG